MIRFVISGDLTTMSLADFLQWADATRVAGVLVLERHSDHVWLQLERRLVVSASQSPTRPVALLDLPNPGAGPEPLDAATLAVEHLYDQFLDSDGSFRFRPGEERSRSGIAVELSLPQLMMEGMRLLDEWPRLNEAYASDAQRLKVVNSTATIHLTPMQRALLHCAERQLTLSQARMLLGLSRPALLRHTDELRALGFIEVEGATGDADLATRLVGQAQKLLREKQFDEAGHVFAALLTTDPTATAARHLLRQAEREHILWLYEEIPPHTIPVITSRNVDRRTLTHADREVLERINDRWDVSVLVLICPLREVETMKSLRKLLRLRAIDLKNTLGATLSRSEPTK